MQHADMSVLVLLFKAILFIIGLLNDNLRTNSVRTLINECGKLT